MHTLSKKERNSHRLLKMELCVLQSLDNVFEFRFHSQNILTAEDEQMSYLTLSRYQSILD